MRRSAALKGLPTGVAQITKALSPQHFHDRVK
jgi:hypothetical protein